MRPGRSPRRRGSRTGASLDLIHPHPLPADEDVRRGEEFLARLRDFCGTKVDGALIEREARIPDEVINGLKELGALGMLFVSELAWLLAYHVVEIRGGRGFGSD